MIHEKMLSGQTWIDAVWAGRMMMEKNLIYGLWKDLPYLAGVCYRASTLEREKVR